MSMLKLTSLQSIFISEIILVSAMIIGVAPQEFSYLILVLLIISFIKLSLLDSLKLFILSLPFFVALPANSFSDSMSAWRVLIVVLFLKVVWEKYFIDTKKMQNSPLDKRACLSGRQGWGVKNFAMSWSRISKSLSNGSAEWRNKLWSALRFHSPEAGTMEPAESFDNAQDDIVQNNIVQNNIAQDDKINKLFLLAALFFTIAILSLISAQNLGAGIRKLLFFANIFFLFPVVIYAIKKESDLMEILKAVFYSSVIIVSIGYFQFLSTFLITLSQFWEFWANNVIKVFYGQNLSYLLSYSNTWFSYYDALPPTLRMFSVMPDSHSFAMLVTISMPVVLSLLFYYKQGKRKKYLSITLMFFLLAVYLSGSRGAWAGSVFALAMGVYLFLLSSLKARNSPQSLPTGQAGSAEEPACRQTGLRLGEVTSEFIKLLKSKVGFKLNAENNSKHYSKLIAFSVVLFFILMPVSSLILKQNQETQIIKSGINLSAEERSRFSMFERAFSIYDFSETSNKGRLQIWRETLLSIGNHPFLGVGFGNFNYVLEQSESALKKGSSAHSIYLDIASEIGIFGLMVFLFLIAFILESSYYLYFRLQKTYLKIFAGSFFVYFSWVCAYGIFDVVIFNDKVLMIIVMMAGLLYSLSRADQEV